MPRILLAIAFFSFAISCHATEVIVNGNCHITVTSSTGVTIDPATGNLIADGTYGSGCPGGSVPAGPSFSTALHSDQSPATTGVGFTIGWATSNVDNCTTDGSSFPAGASFGSLWPTSGAICSGAACATGSILLTTSVSGTYNFQLHCYKSGTTAPADSNLSLSVTPPDSGACSGIVPSGITRQTSTSIGTVAPVTSRVGVDATHFESAFGYDPTNPSAPLSLWPGTLNTVYGIRVNRNQYIALQFTVPSDFSPSRYGDYYRQQTQTQAPSSWTISTCPGDFRTSSLPNGCYANLSSKGGFFWQTGTTPGICALVPGQTYYLNIITASLSSLTTSSCPGTSSSCNVEMTNEYH